MGDVYDIKDIRVKVIGEVLDCLLIPEVTQLALQFLIEYAKCHFKHIY